MYCPLCGRNVTIQDGKCPVCGAKLDIILARRELDKVIERRLTLKMGARIQDGGYPYAEAPKALPSEAKPKCPSCGNELSGGESKCPRCGITIGGPEELLECPMCGTRTNAEAKSCPLCGAEFVAEEPPTPPEHRPQPALGVTPPPAQPAVQPTPAPPLPSVIITPAPAQPTVEPIPPPPQPAVSEVPPPAQPAVQPAPTPPLPSVIITSSPARPTAEPIPPPPQPAQPAVTEVSPPAQPVATAPPPTAPPEKPEESGLVTQVAGERIIEVAEPAKGVQSPLARGLVNGTGVNSRTGFVNGTGKINGMGMVNGRGAINGTGLVNGTGTAKGSTSDQMSSPSGQKRRKALARWKFLAVLVALMVVIPAFILLSYHHPTGPAIDGKYGDWSGAEMFGMQVQAAGAGIAVQSWSVQSEARDLFLFVSVEGAMMGTSNVDSFVLFVDSDGQPATGYSVSEMGADYMMVLDGWDGAVGDASLMSYRSTTDHLNWNSWASIGSLSYSLNFNEIEAMAELPVDLGSEARYLLLTQTNSPDQDYSVSFPVPEKGGLLIASLEPGPSINQGLGTVPALGGVSLGKLVLSCEGTDGLVTSVTPTVLGAVGTSSVSEVSLVQGEERAYDIVVDTSSTLTTHLVSLLITEGTITSTFADILILQDTVHAYVGAPPSWITIDGAFGDWAGKTKLDNDSLAVTNPNINITSAGYAGESSFAAFYVSVQGNMFQGVFAPSIKAKPSGTGGGGGGTVIPARKSGEDILRIYIDSDMSNSTGAVIMREGKTIGAEYLVDIRGSDGLIVSKSLMQWGGSDWSPTTATIYTGKDMQRIELSVPTASIGGSKNISTIIETTDWKQRSDWAWAGTPPDPWVVGANGDTYQSGDGVTWSYVGTPTLVAGDRIVDIAVTSDGTTVVVVTNTGRTYYWDFASSTSWTVGQANPIDTANYSEAVSMTFFSKTGAWLLTKNGSYFYLMNAINPPHGKLWTYQDLAGVGVTDFTDINYQGGTMYALRSGANTSLAYSGNGNIFQSTTNATRSTSNQTEFCYIAGGPAATDDRIFVLCENGNIRYSANGGGTWSAWGNLPTPGGGNTTKYVGLGIDSTGYMWVVTNTGYCYRSTDSTTYSTFTCLGKAPLSSVAAIVPLPYVQPIPEFGLFAVPILGIVMACLLRRTSSKDEDSE